MLVAEATRKLPKRADHSRLERCRHQILLGLLNAKACRFSPPRRDRCRYLREHTVSFNFRKRLKHRRQCQLR
jgi:hypothetical protein